MFLSSRIVSFQGYHKERGWSSKQVTEKAHSLTTAHALGCLNSSHKIHYPSMALKIFETIVSCKSWIITSHNYSADELDQPNMINETHRIASAGNLPWK